MKKDTFKSALIAAMMVMLCLGGWSAYRLSAEKHSTANALLSQNVEALASGDEREFNCFLDKDKCKVKIGNYSSFRLFAVKYGVSGDYIHGDVIDLTDFTKIYTPACSWKIWRDRVRCGVDVTCSDLASRYGFLKGE